jgi:prepilin-type N-terminal cleavage/methylation domain-containing protein
VSLRLRPVGEAGFTIPEMLVVLAIMGIITTALVQLFVSASRTQVDMSNRFQAQQEGRLALDGLRREIHCASAISSTQSGAGWPSTSVKITLGSYCSSAPAGGGDVTWCTETVATGHYRLRRVTPALAVGATCAGGVAQADYLTKRHVFTSYTASGGGLRASLGIDIPIDVSPASGQTGCTSSSTDCYRLTDDIVLRNTART